MECFRVLKYDVEAERLKVPAQGTDKVSTVVSLSSVQILNVICYTFLRIHRLVISAISFSSIHKCFLFTVRATVEPGNWILKTCWSSCLPYNNYCIGLLDAV